MKLRGGATVDDMRGYDFAGREALLPPLGGVPGRKEVGSFVGDCGVAFDSDHLILSDRAGGRLLVFDGARKLVATLSGYSSPTALTVDRGTLFVLTGTEKKELLKLKSWREPQVLARSAPLHKESLQVAVDGQASSPII